VYRCVSQVHTTIYTHRHRVLLTCWSHRAVFEKIKYIHNNPVNEGLVFRPEQYVYSSAVDYNDEKGKVNGIVVVR